VTADRDVRPFSQELVRIRRERKAVEKALDLMPLKGSVVMEPVSCNKPSCHRCPHGPYAYLHYWDSEKGDVRRKYLGRLVAEYLGKSRSDLTRRLEELLVKERRILGQAHDETLLSQERQTLGSGHPR